MTPVLSKMFQHVLVRCLMEFFDIRSLFRVTQFAFRRYLVVIYYDTLLRDTHSLYEALDFAV